MQAKRERKRAASEGNARPRGEPAREPAPVVDYVLVRHVAKDRRAFVVALADLVLADLLRHPLHDPDPSE